MNPFDLSNYYLAQCYDGYASLHDDTDVPSYTMDESYINLSESNERLTERTERA